MNLSLTPLDWIVCIVTLGGSLVLGLYLSVRFKVSENSESFFLAGRRLKWPVIGASIFSTNIGAEHLVGLSGDAYRYGLSAGTVTLAIPICLGITAGLLVPCYMKNKVFTIPELLEKRYAPLARTFFSGLMLLICIMTKMAFTLYAGALVLHSILGYDIMTTVIILGIISAMITVVGGFAAVAYTDTIQTAIIIFGCSMVLIIGLDKVGGWSELVAKVPEAMSIHRPYDDANYPFWGIILGAIYGGTFYFGMDQVNVQRLLGAPNLRQARWGAMFATLLEVTPIFIFVVPGVIALALFPGRDSKTTFITILNELLPSGIRGLVLSALLAALISSLLSVMNSVSTLGVRDFAMRFKPNLSEKAQVHMGRVAIWITMVLGVMAAYFVYKTPHGLFMYLQAISFYLVVPVIPAIAFGIMSKRPTFHGAVASVLAGLILSIIYVADLMLGEAGSRVFPWLHVPLTENYTYRGTFQVVFVTIILFVVSSFTVKTNPEKLSATTINWNEKSEPFEGIKDWRLHLALLSILSIAVYAWLW